MSACELLAILYAANLSLSVSNVEIVEDVLGLIVSVGV